MRIRFKKWARPELEASKFYIDNPEDYKGKWRELFKNPEAPLHLELGCGKGTFMAKLATRDRNVNHIAIDVVDAMLGLAKRNIEAEFKENNMEIDNVYLTRFDIERILLIMDKKDFFDSEIWGFETKKIDDSNIDFRMSSLISQKDITKIHNLFKAFDKIEFMRVDGRMYNGEFHLIELSPDCYLGDDCAFYYAFNSKGYSLSQMFEFLITNSLSHYQL